MNYLISLISKALGMKVNQIHPESDIHRDLNMDRRDIIDVVTGLEDKYDIIIDYSLLDDINTVEDLEQCVEEILSL